MSLQNLNRKQRNHQKSLKFYSIVLIVRNHFHHELLWRNMNATQRRSIISAIFALKSRFNSIFHTFPNVQMSFFDNNHHFIQWDFRFKTIYALRVHCKKQDERKCEICLQAFCKRSALKAHQDEGCERVLDESTIGPNAEENKPTFVDCIVEPTPMEQEIDASFVCEIIPKADGISVNDLENDEDSNQQNDVADDLNHATTSADDDIMQSQTNCRRKVESKVKKQRKARSGERIQRIYEYENADDTNESNEKIYSCYLCRRR